MHSAEVADSAIVERSADTSQTLRPAGSPDDAVSILRRKAAELVLAGRIDAARKVLEALEAITPAAEVLDLARERERRR